MSFSLTSPVSMRPAPYSRKSVQLRFKKPRKVVPWSAPQ